MASRPSNPRELYDAESYSGREETVVGVHTGLHASGIELTEGYDPLRKRARCVNCEKRHIHCYVRVDRETGEARVHDTCKLPECECMCRTHYACRVCGKLHPYGSPCDRPTEEREIDPEAEEEFARIMGEFRRLRSQKPAQNDA